MSGRGAARLEWLADQVQRYRTIRPQYVDYAKRLEGALEAATRRVAPLAVVQVRAKEIQSFADKALRKRGKFEDPVTQFTDLCGARVITPTQRDADSVAEWVKHTFEVDWENSVDTSERLRAAEFGYLSLHFIVSPSTAGADGAFPPSLAGLKAEIQIRTFLQHAWSAFGHDLSYKGHFRLPDRWQRDLARVAAGLEAADETFERMTDDFERYASTSYGGYRTKEQLAEELETLQAILQYDSDNPRLAAQAGKLAMTLGDWRGAVSLMERYVDPAHLDHAYQPLLRDLGVSLCKLHRQNPSSPDFSAGRRFLEHAAGPPNEDPDALASLGSIWKDVDDERARELYQKAFQLDPADYYPLTNFLELEIRRTKSTSICGPLQPSIAAAIERCHSHIQVGIGMPWALYSLGQLELLRGRTTESLEAILRAIRARADAWMLESAASSLERLAPGAHEIPGFEAAQSLLTVARAAATPGAESRRRLAGLAAPGARFPAPVVLLAGSSAFASDEEAAHAQGLVDAAFEGSPTGAAPRRADPLQAWADLLAAEVAPAEVKLLGIGGGATSAFEYRLAIALGAQVGIVPGSRTEDALLADPAWNDAGNLVPLLDDPGTVRAFVGGAAPPLDEESRETIARAIHTSHREAAAATHLAEWDALAPNLKESSRLQADDVVSKLERIGCSIRSVPDREIVLLTFTADEVERLAEAEHGRWNAERLADGWRLGPERDHQRKTSPFLLPWRELPEEARSWDRDAVRRIPEVLKAAGLEVFRAGG